MDGRGKNSELRANPRQVPGKARHQGLTANQRLWLVRLVGSQGWWDEPLGLLFGFGCGVASSADASCVRCVLLMVQQQSWVQACSSFRSLGSCTIRVWRESEGERERQEGCRDWLSTRSMECQALFFWAKLAGDNVRPVLELLCGFLVSGAVRWWSDGIQ